MGLPVFVSANTTSHDHENKTRLARGCLYSLDWTTGLALIAVKYLLMLIEAF